MKRTIIHVDVDIQQGGSFEFLLKVKAPATLRQVLLVAKPKSVVLAKGQPDIALMPRLFFEIDPDAHEVERRYCVLTENEVFDVDGSLVYGGMMVHPQTQRTIFLFEHIPPLTVPAP